MIRTPPPSSWLRLLGVALPLIVATSCLNSPFERINPNDPGADFTLSLTADADSSRTIGQMIQFTATLAPPSPDYDPQWTVSHPALASVEAGRYEVVALPAAGTLPVLVSARFAGRTAQHLIVLRPAIP